MAKNQDSNAQEGTRAPLPEARRALVTILGEAPATRSAVSSRRQKGAGSPWPLHYNLLHPLGMVAVLETIVLTAPDKDHSPCLDLGTRCVTRRTSASVPINVTSPLRLTVTVPNPSPCSECDASGSPRMRAPTTDDLTGRFANGRTYCPRRHL